MAVKVLRVFQEFTSAGYVPMPIAGNIDYGVTVANTFPATTPATFQTDDPDIEVDVTEVTDFYVWIRSHGTAWNYLYTRNVRVYPDSPSINNVVMGIIIARLSDAVPYTGATQDTDLGEFGLKAGWLGLDLTPTNTPTDAGTMSWNDQDGTANLILKGGNVTLQIGQEQVTRVVNKTGSSLLEANYQAVRINGAQGNRLKVALAQANNDANSAETLGLVTETINNNNEGFVTSSGLVRDINTTGSLQGETWADGDILYLSGTTAGRVTNIKPQAPIHTVIIGFVVRAHATQGAIYVKVDNGYELDELHNVKITTPTDKDFLIYDGTNQYWKNRDLFGTTGYLPVYDTTSLLKDSIIYTNGTAIGIGTNVLQSGAVATFGDVAHFTENISLADSKGIVSGGVNMLSRNNLNNQIIIGADGGINDNVAFYAGDLERIRLLANGRLAINKTTASYQVDVQGDVNVSGAFRVNGTIIPNGTVTSVAMSVPTGLVISGSPITSSGTLAVTYAVNYGIPTLTKQSDWDDAYTWVTNFPDQLGNAGKFLTTNGSALSWASLVTGVSSVFGRTGAVVAQSGDYTTAQVTESGNLYYTDARSRSAISLTTTGSSGSATYNSSTGVLNIPTYTLSGLGGEPAITAGTTAQYWRGDKSWQTLNTSVVTEGTNLYYTDARARASLSFVAGSGAYNSTTGVITIPTNTNQLTNGASFITLASLSASAPLSYNNGTGAFSISQASGSTNGFLSSTDWNTFNNKQNALGYTPVPTTRTLTINGTSYDLSVDRSWTISAGLSGSGTTNYVAKFTGSTSIGNSLIYDNGTNVGIGTTSPALKLDVVSASQWDGIRVYNTTASQGADIRVGNDINNNLGFLRVGGSASGGNNQNTLMLGTGGGYTIHIAPNGTPAMTLFNGGNVSIGNTNNTYKLDVSGQGRFTDGTQGLIIGAYTNAGGYGAIYASTVTPGGSNYSLALSSTTTYLNAPNNGNVILASGGNGLLTLNSSGNLGLGVTPSAWTAGGQNIEVGSAGNIIQGQAVQIAIIQNATFNAGWKYSANGFASFVLQTSGQHQWYNAPSGTAGSAISFTQAMTLDASGNLMVGTTSAGGYKLNVNGTGYFGGNLTSNGQNSFFGQSFSTDSNIYIQAGYDGSNKFVTQLRSDYFGAFSIGTTLMPPANSPNTGTYTTRLSFALSGAATFSSDITIGGLYTFSSWTTGTVNKIRGYFGNDDKSIQWNYNNSPAGTLIKDNNSFLLSVNGTNTIFGNSSGNVGFGTASPNQKLSIDSGTSTASYLQFTAGSTTGTASTDGFHIGIDSAGKAIINQRENLSFGISTNNTERILINNSGIITVTGNMRFYYANSPAYVIQLPNNLNDGQAIAYAWVAYSDARVKKNVSELNYGIDSIMKLKPVSYNHHSARNDQGKIDILEKYKYEIGFIAQEVYNVIPEVVNPGNDLELWGMNYERLTSVIVKGMQEQQVMIEQLKEEIKQLKGVN